MKTENQTYLLIFSIFFLLLTSFVSKAQTTIPFAKRFETAGINGDLTIIGNSILGPSVDTPYDGTTNNNFIDMVFVDIDGDAATFNSSSANFSTDNCNRVVYAGLYWGAISAPSSPLPNQVKFKLPGGSYQDLTADAQLDKIYYKDVTSIVAANSNPSGNYFVANVSTTQGTNTSAGWSLVLVYEDPKEARKYISTFDGFSAVRDSPNNTVDFAYSGFTTPPSGPVEGRVGVAALEGDLGWFGDQMLFRADANAAFTALFDAENNVNNFFNSKITKDGTQVTDRNLNSTNTLGWDQKLLNLKDLNVGNGLIGNNETGATVRITNNVGGDHIYSFLNTFSINIIEPVLKVLTSVEDTSGNAITHASPVQLGATVWYNINFQNVGTDNATNTYILNTIPGNVTLDLSSITVPSGVSYTYNSTTRELKFDINASLVEKKELSVSHDIRYQVTASANCFDYSDACTNLLQNSIESYYDGETSGQNISGQPGLNGVNGCGLGIVGSMDLFVDTSSCSFDSELYFCNNTLTFEGDDGYDTYVWTDATGNVIANTKEITVTGQGVYTAIQRRTGCTETIRVVTVLGLDVTVDPVNALCKDSNGSVNITVNEASPNYTYELFQNSSLIASVLNKTSDKHTFLNLDIGNYEVRTTKADGCFHVTPFTITEPTLLQATSVKIYDAATCNGAILSGRLEANGSGGVAPYQYSIDGGMTFQTENTFDVNAEKTYEITVKDANGCTTLTSVAVGLDQEIVYEISKEDVICTGESDGKISVNMINNQGYTITYSLDGINYNASPNFNGLSPGEYELWVKKEKGNKVCETKNIVAVDLLIDLNLTAVTDFSCDGGGNLIIAQVDPIFQNEVTFILDGSNNNTSGIFENVSKGSHTITVKHNTYGCNDVPVILEVAEYIPISFLINDLGINEYEVVASGGEPEYGYSFNSPDDFSDENVLKITKSGDYTFYVRDARGCVEEKTVYLEILELIIPDFFTPEGDGINDTWYPINIEPYPKISVKIFDRYQRMLASYTGNQFSWDGNYKGNALPSGDYWYIVTLNDSSDNREFKGNFTLVR